MNLSIKESKETGSALIDFVLYGLLIQMTVLVFGLQVFSLQSAQLAAESAARHALRSFALEGTDPEESVRSIAKDFNFSEDYKVSFSCVPDCISAGSLLKIAVNISSATAIAKMIL
ncbi:MAG: hypothetical protein RL723_540 [Actinomycetota bacterium]